ncbi:MAG TPA: hypothetical protein VJS92_17615 [Candidatus Polarisedimenticolaceae bacterium]|nr:hypothetical protein [Candidatus Polarisedimenticolaceae bacterium]
MGKQLQSLPKLEAARAALRVEDALSDLFNELLDQTLQIRHSITAWGNHRQSAPVLDESLVRRLEVLADHAFVVLTQHASVVLGSEDDRNLELAKLQTSWTVE